MTCDLAKIAQQKQRNREIPDREASRASVQTTSHSKTACLWDRTVDTTSPLFSGPSVVTLVTISRTNANDSRVMNFEL